MTHSAALLSMYRAGFTVAHIADELGLTRRQVRCAIKYDANKQALKLRRCGFGPDTTPCAHPPHSARIRQGWPTSSGASPAAFYSNQSSAPPHNSG